MPSNHERSRSILDQGVAEGKARFYTEQSAERKRSPADVFVSYSSRDREEARSVCKKLKRAGIAYFLDEKDIEPGTVLSAKLQQEIEKRQYYLLLLSEHSAVSQWVTSEWIFAASRERTLRILLLTKDAPIPPHLANVLADDKPAKLVKYYRCQKYSPFSLQVFLRDMLSPMRLSELGKFQPVPDRRWTWEHQDVGKWPDEDRKRFRDGHSRIPRIARIGIRKNKGLPTLQLQCWLGDPTDLEIKPEGNQLTPSPWWYDPYYKPKPEVVHPAFWNEAMDELIRLLEGKASVLTSPSGNKLELLPAVTWSDL